MNEFGNVAGVKILFVHQNLGAQGGAEANILLTAGEFKRRGHRVALLHATTTGKGEENWRKIFSQCYQLDGAKAAQSTSNALAEFEPEIVYVHNLANLEALEALHAAGIPVVKMVHDHASYCMRGYKYNYFTRAVCQRPASLYCVFPCLASIARNHGPGASLKWVSYAAKKKEIALNRRCQQFVVYSDYSREELIRNGFERDKIHIHVPIQCWGTAGEVSSFSDRNLILFAGQIIRGKGVDFLLEALAQVKAPFECHILGDGNHRAHCDQLSTRLGLNDRVKFGGYVPHEQMKEFYLEASVFAVSSVWP
jgi:glycosyltransferase involved in cell wall biosynthesis